jgi:hypothetical protein
MQSSSAEKNNMPADLPFIAALMPDLTLRNRTWSRAICISTLPPDLIIEFIYSLPVNDEEKDGRVAPSWIPFPQY